MSDGKPCSWKRRLTAACFEQDSTVKIRIQTNSLPNHCIQTKTAFPHENEIDFEVDFNRYTGEPARRAPSLNAGADEKLFKSAPSWTRDDNALSSHNFVRHSGQTEGVVGIAFNGVPIHAATSFDNYGPLFHDLLDSPNAL